MGFRVEWHADRFLRIFGNESDEKTKKVAEFVASRARVYVKKRTGTLAGQISVEESKFKNGGYLVGAQFAGNYERFYASFLELGTFKDEPQPYLRPALHEGRQMMKQEFKVS